MKFPVKNNGYATLIKRVLLVYLVIHTCLWNFLEEKAFSSQEESLAVIISVEGTAKIRSRNQGRLAEEELELYEGDVIITDRLSHVILLYLGEEFIHIPEEKTLKITAELSIPDQGKWAKLKYVLSAAYTGITSSLFPEPVLSSPGAPRKWLRLLEAEIIDLVTPVATKVMTCYPHFKWLPLEGMRKYEITIFDGLGHVIWRHETTKPEFTYPEEAPVLIPGEYYFWQVREVDEKDSTSNLLRNLYLTFEMAYFTVMHEEEIEEVKKTIKEARQIIGTTQDETFNLLLGIYYEKKQLYGKAQEEYEKLVRLKPTNDIYKNMLANVYVKVGRKWAAANLLQE